MRLAVRELEAEHLVTVIDSRNLSTGIGHLVVEAAILAQQGKTAEQIREAVEALRPRVRARLCDWTRWCICAGAAAAVPWPAMAGRCAEASPENCSKRRHYGCIKEIPRENCVCYYGLYEGYGK